MGSLMWLNRNVATINTLLQLLDIYIYIYLIYCKDPKIEPPTSEQLRKV